MCKINKFTFTLLVSLTLHISFAWAGPGFSTGNFGKSESFSEYTSRYSIQNDEGDGPPPGEDDGAPTLEDIPIDGGVALLLLGGLAIGAKRIFRQIMDKAQ